MGSILGCSLDASVCFVLVCIGICCRLNWCLTGLCYCLNLRLIVTVFSVCPSCVLRFQQLLLLLLFNTGRNISRSSMTAGEDASVLYTSINASKWNSLHEKQQIFTQQHSQFLLLFHKISMLQYMMQHLLYQSVSVVLYLSTVQPFEWKSLQELHNKLKHNRYSIYSRSYRANKLTLLVNIFYIH